MFEKLKNILFYIGVDKNSYKLVLKDISRSNRTMVEVFSGLATALIGVMCIIPLFINSTVQNQLVYFVGFLAALSLFLISIFFSKNRPWLVTLLVYIAFSIFWLYGIFIGAITNPTQQTVTFMVLLVFMPIIFIDRLIRSFIVTLVFVIVFIVLCLKNKTGNVLSTDIMDAVIYSILGLASGTIINHIKVQRYMLEYILQDACRFDQLTRMNNRNSFEADMPQYENKCTESLACVYLDVNGLHELNNTQGHLMGDLMLQYVAEQIINTFGVENSYRIGGDEFVAFVVDKTAAEVEEKLAEIKKLIEEKDYNAAIGYELYAKYELEMEGLIRAAESNMYQSKRQFYENGTRDRRKR